MEFEHILGFTASLPVCKINNQTCAVNIFLTTLNRVEMRVMSFVGVMGPSGSPVKLGRWVLGTAPPVRTDYVVAILPQQDGLIFSPTSADLPQRAPDYFHPIIPSDN